MTKPKRVGSQAAVTVTERSEAMSGRTIGFVVDTRTQITQFLQNADNWSNLQQEYAAMTANGSLPTQADVDEAFGGPGVITLAQYNQALVRMQAVVDNIHTTTNAHPLYRVKR